MINDLSWPISIISWVISPIVNLSGKGVIFRRKYINSDKNTINKIIYIVLSNKKVKKGIVLASLILKHIHIIIYV